MFKIEIDHFCFWWCNKNEAAVDKNLNFRDASILKTKMAENIYHLPGNMTRLCNQHLPYNVCEFEFYHILITKYFLVSIDYPYERVWNQLKYLSNEHVVHQSPQTPPINSFSVSTPGQDFWCPVNCKSYNLLLLHSCTNMMSCANKHFDSNNVFFF